MEEPRGIGQLWQRKDKKTKGLHYFKRTVAWDEALLIKDKDTNKEKLIRLSQDFYWKDKSSPSYNRNEIDNKFPENYMVIKRFKSGDKVNINGERGVWEITKLGQNATLNNIETMSKKTTTYKNLVKIRSRAKKIKSSV